jgi:hypothetical protein
MHSLPKCESNGTLTSLYQTATFDAAKGQATFKGLSIDHKGMYILIINVQTIGSSDYSFNCISTPILVKSSAQVLKSAEEDKPNAYLTFTGNFTQHKKNMSYYESMLYNCIFIKHDVIMDRSISLYQGSIKSLFSFSGNPSNFEALIQNLANFTLNDDVILLSGTLFDNDYNFSSPKVDDSSSLNVQITSEKAAAAEKQNAVCFIIYCVY